MAPFLIGEQVETIVAKEGSSSGQPAGPPSLERRVHATRTVRSRDAAVGGGCLAAIRATST
ncbi:hypothetical protein [Acetobacter oeni]|uniref:hypothetical protein n=1 Tax=Acetobacter oeni TaxID=304077 RepID=UPI0011BD6D2A|nr:hypothetical protein [Acetobacter oeni]